MIVSAIGRIPVVVIVNRNSAIAFMMVVCIHTDLRRTMRCLVHRPCRGRNAHTERKPDKGQQVQQGADGAIHDVRN